MSYAFTVEALGWKWDVYRFTKDGVPGTFAFRQEGAKFVIGFFRAGEFTPDEVRRAIVEACI